MKTFKITKKEALPESSFVIEGEIAVEELESHRKAALEKFQGLFAMDGFRKGHIPEKVLVEKVGELAITEEEGSLALEKNYEAIVKEVDIFPIGQPKVSILKITPGQPMQFKIETAVAPEVKLPNYKKIAKEAMAGKDGEVTVDEKDLEDAIKEIRTSIAHQKLHQTEGETEHHNHDFKEEDLPVLDDAFVKTLGQFESAEDFKNKLKDNLLNEKKVKAREKKRLEAIESIIKDTKAEVPAVLVESELLKMVGQFKDSITSMGMTYEDYLQKVSKTEEQIKDEWRDEAKKRALIQLVLSEIAKEEKIEVPVEDIKHQTDQLLAMYKDADPFRISVYVETMMLNDKVWQFLEAQK